MDTQMGGYRGTPQPRDYLPKKDICVILHYPLPNHSVCVHTLSKPSPSQPPFPLISTHPLRALTHLDEGVLSGGSLFFSRLYTIPGHKARLLKVFYTLIIEDSIYSPPPPLSHSK